MKKQLPYVRNLYAAMREAANPDYAPAMKKYMKDVCDFMGIASPLRAALLRDFIKNEGLPDYDQLPLVVRQLWQLPAREMHYCAIDISIKLHKQWNDDILGLSEEMILMTSWWDTTDAISSGIIGEYLRKQSHIRIRDYAEHLMKSENMWLQRTALIFQRRYKHHTDKELLFSLCERLSESKEFFIRKGMGWALREYAYQEPELVREFVLNHPVSALTRREALKHIGE